MATTTNYGWVTPDDTSLVKDGAAAIRTLGSSVDTTTKALNPSTTLGDIEYRSATANTNTRLAIGSTGNILTVSGGVPAWVAPSGGGKVLQVVQSTLTGSVSTTSTSFIDTGLTVSITPSAATSKVLILTTHCAGAFKTSGSDAGVYFNLLRGATGLNIPGDSFASYLNVVASTGARELFSMVTFSYLDSPATTSSTTYKTQYKVSNGSGEANHGSSTSSIIALEIGA
jgi:hypothetical protein